MRFEAARAEERWAATLTSTMQPHAPNSEPFTGAPCLAEGSCRETALARLGNAVTR